MQTLKYKTKRASRISILISSLLIFRISCVCAKNVFAKSVCAKSVFAKNVFAKNVFAKSVFAKNVCGSYVCGSYVCACNVYVCPRQGDLIQCCPSLLVQNCLKENGRHTKSSFCFFRAFHRSKHLRSLWLYRTAKEPTKLKDDNYLQLHHCPLPVL